MGRGKWVREFSRSAKFFSMKVGAGGGGINPMLDSLSFFFFFSFFHSPPPKIVYVNESAKPAKPPSPPPLRRKVVRHTRGRTLRYFLG